MPMDKPRDNSKNPGLTYVGLWMRSTDPNGKLRKKFEFSIFLYLKLST
jgi:hypothetical protein